MVTQNGVQTRKQRSRTWDRVGQTYPVHRCSPPSFHRPQMMSWKYTISYTTSYTILYTISYTMSYTISYTTSYTISYTTLLGLFSRPPGCCRAKCCCRAKKSCLRGRCRGTLVHTKKKTCLHLRFQTLPQQSAF